jgi:hypothetical protein
MTASSNEIPVRCNDPIVDLLPAESFYSERAAESSGYGETAIARHDADGVKTPPAASISFSRAASSGNR